MARLFAKGGAGLENVTISQAARRWLSAHLIEKVHLLIRGDARNTRFSPAELKEVTPLKGLCATVATDVDSELAANDGDNLTAYELFRQWSPIGKERKSAV